MTSETCTDGAKLARMVRTLYPFAGVEYNDRGNLRIIRYNNSPNGEVYKGEGTGNRKDVYEFSLQSRKALLKKVKNFDGEFKTFCSLTYPSEFELDGRRVKKDLNKVLGVIRSYYPDGVNYVWWLEFQERDAPHIHLAFDKDFDDVLGRRIQKSWSRDFDKRFGLGSKEKSDYVYSLGRVVEPVRKGGGVGRYLAKYITKDRQKVVPESYRDTGRFWGTNRDFPLIPTRTLFLEQWELVSLLRAERPEWDWTAKIDILPANVYDTGVDFSLIKRTKTKEGGWIYCDVQLDRGRVYGDGVNNIAVKSLQYDFTRIIDNARDKVDKQDKPND